MTDAAPSGVSRSRERVDDDCWTRWPAADSRSPDATDFDIGPASRSITTPNGGENE